MPSTSPAPTLNIKIGDNPHEITMFFGRLNELAELVQDFQRLPEVDLHAPTTVKALDICLAPRDERGRRTETDWCIPPDLSIEDAEAVLDFAKEHLADFFLGRVRKHISLVQASGEQLTDVASLLSGLADSASKKP